MSRIPGIVTHAQKVCRAYKKAVREYENVYNNRHDFRYHATVLRSEFEKNRDIKDMRVAKKLLMELEEKLWYYAHPQPMKFANSPGGVAYDREPPVPDFIVDLWHPIEKAFYPKYFALREKRKKDYEEFYYKQYPDQKPKQVPKE